MAAPADTPEGSELPPVRPIPALAASGELATAILEAVPETAVQVFDAELRVILLAGGALRRHGRDPAAMFGRGLDEVIPERMVGIIEPPLRRALAGERVQYDYEAFDESACFDVSVVPLRDFEERIIGAVQFVRDVTAQKAAEQALEAAQARDRAAFVEAPVAMGLCTTEGRWTAVNLEFARMLKATPDSLVGSHLLESTHPDDAESTERFFAGSVAGQAIPGRWVDKRYLAADGSAVPVRVSASAVREGGEISYFVVHVLER